MEALKLKNIFLTAGLWFCLSNFADAQGWDQDRTGIYSIGVGGTQGIALAPGFAGITAPGLSINVSGEYRVARWVGVGFETGLALFPGYYANPVLPGEPIPNPRYISLAIPMAAKVNFHILEATGVSIARQLDAYAGLNVGVGPGFYTGPNGSRAFALLQTGPQFGVRYWPVSNVAIFSELGWGATFANAGVTF